jgi:hypothetical protein
MRENLTSGSMRGSRGGPLGRYGKAITPSTPKGGRHGSPLPVVVGSTLNLFSTLPIGGWEVDLLKRRSDSANGVRLQRWRNEMLSLQNMNAQT